jgi:hypothetical protein
MGFELGGLPQITLLSIVTCFNYLGKSESTILGQGQSSVEPVAALRLEMVHALGNASYANRKA